MTELTQPIKCIDKKITAKLPKTLNFEFAIDTNLFIVVNQ